MSEHLRTQPNTPRLDVGEIVKKIGTSPDYIKARNVVERDATPEARRRPAAIRMAAVALRGKEEGSYFTLEEHALNLTAHLTTIESHLEQLDRLRGRRATRREKLPYLEKVTAFNHALKEMIDSNPRLGFNEVVSFLRNMNQQIHGRHNDRHFEHEIRGVLEGMRHEIAAEQIIGQLENVDVDHVSIEEDLDGGDLMVSVDNSPWTPIDIKASYLTAERAKQKARDTGHDDSGIIWSQLNDEDFNGGFRISYDKAAEKAPLLEAALRRATRTESIAV